MLTAENRAQIAHLIQQEISQQSPGPLTLKEAKHLAALAEQKAKAIGVPIVISIADTEGQQILFHRMTSSLPASAQLATDKAHTAASFRMSTHELGLLAQPGGMLFGVQANNGGRTVLFGGGVPVRRNGVVVGAIGVSGGTADEDMLIADHALYIFLEHAGRCPEEG
ncbi:GlcG/HbpS family heme-binding protein [Cohaesibacter celericrescens]|uniref:Heme-binding protein n=1 Tax=Cohaesibacter celericrescens TaxID=2067669 RepID=A0A2N5XQN8_9HYPH|nr:heme-binding protein [Cohaesibacter celericrescens]PLW76836.1 heme-binding protein [Cohaesibacter celericrescens]